MKKLTYFLLFILTALITSCSSCSNKQEQTNKDDFDIPTEFEEKLSGKDTAEVKEMVAVFVEHLKNERYYDAAGMLYRFVRENGERFPQLYDNDDIERFVKVHQLLPVVDYKIEYMRFREADSNEVCITIIMKRGANGEKDDTSKMFINPIYYHNKWCLVMNDTLHGANTVVPIEKRDSMTNVYAQRERGLKPRR